jgi:hypothetical protein
MLVYPYEFTRRQPRTSWWSFGKGGWAETMALVEALLGGGLIAFVSWWSLGSFTGEATLLLTTALGTGAGCFVWRRLLQRADTLYSKELSNGRDGSVPLR